MSHNTWHNTHPHLVCVCFCGHNKVQQYTFHCDSQLLLLCGSVSCVVTVINTSACFILTGSHKGKDEEEEKDRNKARLRKGGEVSWCSIWQLDYSVDVIYHKLFRVSRNAKTESNLTLYMDRSILRELWSWSRSLTNRSFCRHYNTH